MKTLYLMVGIPGSGKSTWIKNRIDYQKEKWVSRDEIRFNLLKEDEEYFSHEKEVYKIFVKEIQDGLNDRSIENVYADATHLNGVSRIKLLRRLKLENVAVVPVVFYTPLDVCIRRNEERSGRAHVEPHVIEDMASSFTIPKRNGNEMNYYDIIEVRR